MYHLLDPPLMAQGSAPEAQVCLPRGTTGATGSPVVCIAVHPDLNTVFAVVTAAGCVAVFCTERRTPAGVWSCPVASIAAVWLPGAPSHLAVVCAAGTATIVDAAMDACQGRAACVAVRLPERCSCVAVAVARMDGAQEAADGSGGDKPPQSPLGVLVLLLSDGSCVYHALGGYTSSSTGTNLHDHLICAV